MSTSPSPEVKKGRREKTLPKKRKEPHALFAFSVERWSCHYGLTLMDKRCARDGICSENLEIVLEGPLLEPTARKVDRLRLYLCSRDYVPMDWEEGSRLIGLVNSIVDGEMSAAVFLPTRSFPALMMGFHSGKFRGVEILVYEFTRGRGIIRRFSTVDPDEYAENAL